MKKAISGILLTATLGFACASNAAEEVIRHRTCGLVLQNVNEYPASGDFSRNEIEKALKVKGYFIRQYDALESDLTLTTELDVTENRLGVFRQKKRYDAVGTMALAESSTMKLKQMIDSSVDQKTSAKAVDSVLSGLISSIPRCEVHALTNCKIDVEMSLDGYTWFGDFFSEPNQFNGSIVLKKQFVVTEDELSVESYSHPKRLSKRVVATDMADATVYNNGSAPRELVDAFTDFLKSGRSNSYLVVGITTTPNAKGNYEYLARDMIVIQGGLKDEARFESNSFGGEPFCYSPNQVGCRGSLQVKTNFKVHCN